MPEPDAGGLRVLCVVPGPPYGGAEGIALRLSRLLAATGCVMRTLTALDPTVAPGAVHDKWIQQSRKAALPLTLATLRRAITGFRPDVIYVHNRWHAAMALLARRRSIAIVLHCHDAGVRKLWTYWGDRAIAVSPSVAAHIVRLGADRAKVTVVFNGVPRNTVTPAQEAELRTQLRVPTDRNVIVYVGRMSHTKGPHILLQALTGCDDAFGILAGDGPTLGALRKSTVDQRLEQRVRLPGFVGEPEALYALADLTIVPSLVAEGLPLSVLESFNAGVPVVASAVGGTTDVVKDGVNGILVPPGDAAALLLHLEGLLADPARREALADGARKTAAEFSEERMVAGVLGVLQDAAAGRAA